MSEDQYGVQDDGRFIKKDVVDIRDNLERYIKNELGDDISLRQNSPIKQLIDAFSIEISRQWEAAEDSYYASFFKDAEGEQLDKQLALAGFSRRNLQPAEGAVVFSRDGPATRDIDISEGTVVTTERTETRPQIPFETQERVTLFSGETETDPVPIKALAPWQTELGEEWLGEETNVSSDTIVRMEDPIGGIDDVTNPKPTGSEGDLDWQDGRDRETDAEFKLRYENTLSSGGVSTVPAIESSVSRFDERIRSVRVEEIRDAETGYGPEVTVFAPMLEDEDDGMDIIAQAVFESRGAGLESFGSVTGTATTADGREVEEQFELADEVAIHIEVTLVTSDIAPEDNIQRIENEIVRFIGGKANDDILYPGLEIGDDVILDQVKQRVMEVRGSVEAAVEIGPDGEVSDENVDIGDLEVATTDLDDITIEVE